MKRLMATTFIELTDRRPLPAGTLPPGAAWQGFVLPAIPSADWPLSLTFDHAIDRFIREAVSANWSVAEMVTGIGAIARSLSLPLNDAEINRRIHAQLVAQT